MGRNRGFSVIEFIIAIVVLGVLFLMVLKGADFILSIRALMVAREFQQFQQKIEVYRSTFNGALPGDDPMGPGRFNRPKALSLYGQALGDATGDGKIQGRMNDFRSPDSEQFMVWRDLRYADLIDGDETLVGFSALPEHEFGGVFAIDEGNLGQEPPGSLCATKIPGAAAQQIDARNDDGRIDAGRMVATSKNTPAETFNHFDKPDSEPYSVDKEYILCAPMTP